MGNRSRLAAAIAMTLFVLFAPLESLASGEFVAGYAEKDLGLVFEEGVFLHFASAAADEHRYRMTATSFYAGLPRLLAPVRAAIAEARAEGVAIEPFQLYLWGIRVHAEELEQEVPTESLKRLAGGPFPQNLVLGSERYTFWFTIGRPLEREALSRFYGRIAAAITAIEKPDGGVGVEDANSEQIRFDDLVFPAAELESELVAVCATGAMRVRPSDARVFGGQLRELTAAVKGRFDRELDEQGVFTPFGVRPRSLPEARRSLKRGPSENVETGDTICDQIDLEPSPGAALRLLSPYYIKPTFTVRVFFALGHVDAAELGWRQDEDAARKLVNGAITELRDAVADIEPPGSDGSLADGGRGCTACWVTVFGVGLLAMTVVVVIIVRRARRRRPPPARS